MNFNRKLLKENKFKKKLKDLNRSYKVLRLKQSLVKLDKKELPQ